MKQILCAHHVEWMVFHIAFFLCPAGHLEAQGASGVLLLRPGCQDCVALFCLL